MKYFAPIAVTLLLTASTAAAADRAVRCHDCSGQQMSRAATLATNEGTVHVFDDARAHVQTYRVFTEYLHESPRGAWTQATAVETDSGLRRVWENFLNARDEFVSGGPVILPPDFSYRSVAGAIVSGAGATTAIEQHLLSLSEAEQLVNMAQAVLGKLLNVQVPLLDINGLVGTTVVTIQFPDGSQQDYRIELSLNVQTGRSRIELERHGNALDVQGRAVPTSALGFRDRVIHDYEGSIFEWSALARRYGVSVEGEGTTMVCQVFGDLIRCRLVYRP